MSGSKAFSLSSSAILRRRARRSAADEESWGRRGASRSKREGSPKLLKSSGYSESHVLNTVHTALQGQREVGFFLALTSWSFFFNVEVHQVIILYLESQKNSFQIFVGANEQSSNGTRFCFWFLVRAMLVLHVGSR